MVDHVANSKNDNSGIYEGKVKVSGNKIASVAAAANMYKLGKIIKRFDQWAITEYGLECLVLYYPITKAQFDLAQ